MTGALAGFGSDRAWQLDDGEADVFGAENAGPMAWAFDVLHSPYSPGWNLPRAALAVFDPNGAREDQHDLTGGRGMRAADPTRWQDQKQNALRVLELGRHQRVCGRCEDAWPHRERAVF